MRDLFGPKNVIETREPGGTDFGQRVREIIKSEPNIDITSQWHLIEAQRQHHVEQVIKPNRNKHIICDRYIWTSYAYQHEYYKNDKEWRQYLGCKYPVPDTTFLLVSNNIPEIKSRISSRNEVADHFDQESVSDLQVKQLLYMKAYAMFPTKIVLVNADRPVETVHEEIIRTFIDRRLVYNTI
jgi:dTMP kinase